MESQATTLAQSAESLPDAKAKINAIYRKVLSRDPTPAEVDLSSSYLESAELADFAQALLSSSEVIFWP